MNFLQDNPVEDGIVQLARQMRKEIVVETLWANFKKYQACFTGEDAVRWMMINNHAETRSDAVALGQRVLRAGFIEHVTREKAFSDSHTFFRFTPNVPSTMTKKKSVKASEKLTPEQANRAVAAILGALVADAATVGVHGIPDGQTIYNTLMRQRQVSPEFFNNCNSPLAAVGENSALGYEALTLLKSLIKRSGLDGGAYCKDMYDDYRAYGGLLQPNARDFIKRVESGHVYPDSGAKDKSVDFLAKIPFITARYAGTGHLLYMVDRCIGTQQSNTDAIAWAKTCALILEKIILGMSVKDAMKWAILPGSIDKRHMTKLLKVVKHGNLAAQDAVKQFGHINSERN